MSEENLFIDGKAGKLAVRIKRPAQSRGTVVLVQGANMSGQLGYDLQVEGHPDYSFMDALNQAGFTAITFSIRGYFQSELNGDPHDVQTGAAIEDLVSVLDWVDGLGGPKTHLLGWSWGGRITARMLEQYPDRIDRLVLFDPALGGGQIVPFPGKEKWWQNSYEYFYDRLHAEYTEEGIRVGVATQASTLELNAPNGIRVENENGSTPAKASAITRPTLMLYGEAAGSNAYMHGAAVPSAFFDAIPNQDKALVIVPGGCDYIHLQRPRRRVHRIVADFLSLGEVA